MDNYIVYEVLDTQPFFRKIDRVKAMTSESARRKAIIGSNTEYSKTYTIIEKRSHNKTIFKPGVEPPEGIL